MKIVNLEQLRASRALVDAQKIVAGQEGGDQLSGYFSYIITNGLLATLAYSADKGGECKAVAECLIGHLANLQGHGHFPGDQLRGPESLSLTKSIGLICNRNTSPQLLAMMTDECMAYLNYLKRFVRALKSEREVKEP